jgi:hypothetical protein
MRIQFYSPIKKPTSHITVGENVRAPGKKNAKPGKMNSLILAHNSMYEL